MSKRKKNNPGNPGPHYVTAELCTQRHEGLAKEMGETTAEIKLLRRALVGDDLQGGLVKKVNDLYSKVSTAGTVMSWVKPIVISFLSVGGFALFLKLIGALH